MATLTEEQRQELRRLILREVSNWRDPSSDEFLAVFGSATKADVRAVIDYTDNWMETNQTSFLSGIPEPGATQLSTRAKAYIFDRVWNSRYKNILGGE